VNGGQPVSWAWDKTRELFFCLLHVGPRRREQIVTALWPDASPDSVKASLHTAVYRLRRATHQQVLQLTDGVYRINPELIDQYDVREFDRLLREGQAASGDTAVQLLQAAVDLYAGPFLQDHESDWCLHERDLLERRYVTALESLITAYADTGRPLESIAATEQLLAHDALREDLYLHLVQTYLRLGDRTMARRQIDRCTAVLWEELGIEPGDEMQAYLERLKT
jgi:DNA-binding SARP family transcriptional activator